MSLKDIVIKNQQILALVIGYILVFALAFGLGRITVTKPLHNEIRVEEASDPQVNNSAEVQGAQLIEPQASVTAQTNSKPSNCAGKVKGNISSSEKIYHVPGGAFYNRTNAEMCFDNEDEAKAAGFRKSSR